MPIAHLGKPPPWERPIFLNAYPFPRNHAKKVSAGTEDQRSVRNVHPELRGTVPNANCVLQEPHNRNPVKENASLTARKRERASIFQAAAATHFPRETLTKQTQRRNSTKTTFPVETRHGTRFEYKTSLFSFPCCYQPLD